MTQSERKSANLHALRFRRASSINSCVVDSGVWWWINQFVTTIKMRLETDCSFPRFSSLFSLSSLSFLLLLLFLLSLVIILHMHNYLADARLHIIIIIRTSSSMQMTELTRSTRAYRSPGCAVVFSNVSSFWRVLKPLKIQLGDGDVRCPKREDDAPVSSESLTMNILHDDIIE